MTVGEFLDECERARKHFRFVVVKISRIHAGARMQVIKGLLGTVVGSDHSGVFVSVEIAKAEERLKNVDRATEMPKVHQNRAKVLP